MLSAVPCCRHPEWLALLPPAVSRRLSSYAALPPPGWRGQAVRLAVMLEELLLPGGDTQALERPRISHYCTAFRLPGVCCCLGRWCLGGAAGHPFRHTVEVYVCFASY